MCVIAITVVEFDAGQALRRAVRPHLVRRSVVGELNHIIISIYIYICKYYLREREATTYVSRLGFLDERRSDRRMWRMLVNARRPE